LIAYLPHTLPSSRTSWYRPYVCTDCCIILTLPSLYS